jgi:SAM-dependent methyltransferase
MESESENDYHYRMSIEELSQPVSADGVLPFGGHLPVDKIPAHWLMARLGKRVLRPGGVETTRWLLDAARITAHDDVIELAPGVGATARELLARRPASYVGIERDAAAARLIRDSLGVSVANADASRSGLASGSASVVVGEALLSMQGDARKRAILREVHRLLRPGGRYVVHELGVTPDETGAEALSRIERDLSRSIRVNVRVGTPSRWRGWLEDEGFEVEARHVAPMRLLEPDRMIADEGVAGTARMLFNMLSTPGATRRLWDVGSTFRRHAAHLCAVALVARRR